MPHVYILYNQLQKRTIDPIEISIAITKFKKNIIKKRNNIDIFLNEDTQTLKRKKTNDTNDSRMATAKEVCDIIVVNIKNRFEYKDHYMLLFY